MLECHVRKEMTENVRMSSKAEESGIQNHGELPDRRMANSRQGGMLESLVPVFPVTGWSKLGRRVCRASLQGNGIINNRNNTAIKE
jgi:hypothetical protein